MDHHTNDCQEGMIQCDKCDLCFKRKDKDEHPNFCSEEDTQCKDCRLPFIRKEEVDHNCFKDMQILIARLKLENEQLRQGNQHQKIDNEENH